MKRGVHFFALLYAPLFSQDLEKSEIFRDNENIGKWKDFMPFVTNYV